METPVGKDDGKPFKMSTPMGVRNIPGVEGISRDVGEWTKTMWAVMTAAGQSKDAEKVRQPLATRGLSALLSVNRASGLPGAQINAVFDEFFKKDALLIRPSGNALGVEGFKEMLASPDIIVESDVVSSIDDVKEISKNNVAVVTFTTLSKFSYKGTPNDDVAKFTMVLELCSRIGTNAIWRVVHLHRGTGQKPA